MTRVSLIRRLMFSVLTLCLATLGLEACARGYNYVRYRNQAILWYGGGFVKEGPKGWRMLQERFPIETVRQQEALTDDAFRRRGEPDGLNMSRTPRDAFVNGVIAHFNNLGFRGRDFTPIAAPGVTRVLTLGGSYVFGAKVEDRDAWPYVLEQTLNQANHQYEVLNGGVNGANVHEVLLTLIRLSQRLSFDYALVTTAYNNHALLPVNRQGSLAHKLQFALYNLSVFDVMVSEKLGAARGQPVDYILYRQRVSVDHTAVTRLVRAYHERLRQMAEVCRAHKTALVLAAQPEVFFDADVMRLDTLSETDVARFDKAIAAGHEVWLPELEFYLQGRFNLDARETSRELGVPFFDGVHALPADNRRFFADQIHLNRDGSRILAEALAAFFARRP